MAYQALYRKYRPGSFDDFIDQENVKTILVNSIKNNKISHAYLFSGPRGIGKTSMAKIFAKAINCINFEKNNDVCDECNNCKIASNSVDIIEIDAASNNGVDQIRDLKNKISVVPSELKYKVYIIDEVHMLTNSAFNALLKTLEEPPSHVVFILATTEFYEVPETIVSRCQCFSFGRIKQASLEARLRYIADRENIAITDDAIKEIAHFSNGGLRDAIGMLDKLNSFTNEEITVDVFKSINGIISLDDIEKVYNSSLNCDLKGVLEVINKVDEQGYDFKNFIERTMLLTRDKVISYYEENKDIIGEIESNIEFIGTLNDILNRLKNAVNPLVIVQIYLLKYVERNSLKNDQNNTSKIISREIIVKNGEKVAESVQNFEKSNTFSEKFENNSETVKNDPADKGKNDDKNIISREIFVKNDEKVTKMLQKTPENVQKDEISQKNGFGINEKIRQIRINNAMATANINYKKELFIKWNDIENYFMDEKYGKVAQLLSDATVMVVGDNYAILTTVSDGIIENIYQNLMVVEEFLKEIYKPLHIVVVLNEEFEKIKNKYIEDRKKNIIYQVQEEYDKLIVEKNKLINQAINIFGADMVEIE